MRMPPSRGRGMRFWKPSGCTVGIRRRPTRRRIGASSRIEKASANVSDALTARSTARKFVDVPAAWRRTRAKLNPHRRLRRDRFDGRSTSGRPSAFSKTSSPSRTAPGSSSSAAATSGNRSEKSVPRRLTSSARPLVCFSSNTQPARLKGAGVETSCARSACAIMGWRRALAGVASSTLAECQVTEPSHAPTRTDTAAHVGQNRALAANAGLHLRT